MVKRKIVVGMSGGVDSSMSLLLLKRAGWDPVGVTLKLPVWKGGAAASGCKVGTAENICCTEESLRIARSVCRKLGVKHYLVDARREFREEVMAYFYSELEAGRTPNPCAVCNPRLKFAKLFEFASGHGIEWVATGHYAATRANRRTGATELVRPKDRVKDQTYGLSLLPQRFLRRMVFPLGRLTKEEVYSLAGREGFEVFLKRRQSQDICFVAGDLQGYLEEQLGENKGNIVDSLGNTAGTHRGLHFHTVGQKRGIGIPGEHYVSRLDSKRNELVVVEDRKGLLRKEVVLTGFNFISGKPPGASVKVKAQVRYRQKPVDAVLYPPARGKVRVVFSKPVEAVAPGQVCAAYVGSSCIGGGFMESAS